MPEIKQILPIPDSLTVLTHERNEISRWHYIDAIAKGETVLYALVTTEDGQNDILFYVGDYFGCFELVDEDSIISVLVTPTIHCRKCGKRMIAYTTHEDPECVRYRCSCGEIADDGNDWLW